MHKCQYCARETTNPGANKKHEISCKENPNRVPGFGGRKKGSAPWNKGLIGVQEAWNKGKPGTFKGKKHTKESRNKISKQKIALYASGWECVAGRCPKYDYNSPIAGNIKVDGGWELIFCKYADAKSLNWKRNKKRFSYKKVDGTSSTYQPDFYVEDWKAYVEVKGYETDLDKTKWSQFPEKLIILRRKEISELDEWTKSTLC